MKLPAENTANGAWLDKKSLRTGDVLKIVSEAKIEAGQNGDQVVAKVVSAADREPKNIAINKPSRIALIAAFGDDTLNWVDKKVTAHVENVMIAGKRAVACYLVPEGYEVTEDSGGFLVVSPVGGNIPGTTKQYPDEEINPEDIPF